MKKFFAVLLIALGITVGAVAQEGEDLVAKPVDTSTQKIVPEEQHVVKKTASVTIYYTPMTDEVIIYYVDLKVSFDQGDAMNTILACLKDFQAQQGYLSYKFLSKDKVRYYKDDNKMTWARYESRVHFGQKSAFSSN